MQAIIYHSRDLDGWMSAAIICKAVNINPAGNYADTQLIGYDYGQPIPDLEQFDKVYMADVSFPINDMVALYSRLKENFIWIDHHKSAIEEWGQMIDKIGIRWPEGRLATNFAACELCWMELIDEDENKMPSLVQYLGLYDSFRHKGTHIEKMVLRFQYAARAYIHNVRDAYEFLKDWNEDDAFERFLNAGYSIYNYLCVDAKQNFDRGFDLSILHKDKVFRFKAVDYSRLNPVNFGIDYHAMGYAGFACFWYNGRIWSWSLYNDDGRVDCSAICKALGGGGHKGAAGFTCSSEDLIEILNTQHLKA